MESCPQSAEGTQRTRYMRASRASVPVLPTKRKLSHACQPTKTLLDHARLPSGQDTTRALSRDAKVAGQVMGGCQAQPWHSQACWSLKWPHWPQAALDHSRHQSSRNKCHGSRISQGTCDPAGQQAPDGPSAEPEKQPPGQPQPRPLLPAAVSQGQSQCGR